MSQHFVNVGGVYVNPWQVCYLREYWEGDEPKGTFIGFHGGAMSEEYHGGMQTNELLVDIGPVAVMEKLEAAMQNEVFMLEGGAE